MARIFCQQRDFDKFDDEIQISSPIDHFSDGSCSFTTKFFVAKDTFFCSDMKGLIGCEKKFGKNVNLGYYI